MKKNFTASGLEFIVILLNFTTIHIEIVFTYIKLYVYRILIF